jgi:hypothetical protein
MRYKDLWFTEYERHLAELEDAGTPPERQADIACHLAHASAADKLAEQADRERKRKRGE